LIIFNVRNITGKAFLEVTTSAQARREQLSSRLTVGRGQGRREEYVARQLMQIDVAQFPELVLDNAALLLAHRLSAAVQVIAFQDPIDGRGRG
jgi:hypothetical protein